MYPYTCGSSSGLPHSSHSVTVSGSDGSRMELSASTKGTCATIPANASGARLATAGHQLVGGGPAGLDQVVGAGDEVGEAVLLRQQLAVGVPVAAQLAAAAH